MAPQLINAKALTQRPKSHLWLPIIFYNKLR